MKIPTTQSRPAIWEAPPDKEFLGPPIPPEKILQRLPPETRMRQSLVTTVPMIVLASISLAAIVSLVLKTHVPFTTTSSIGLGALLVGLVQQVFGIKKTNVRRNE